jgi:hypothetical protein
VKRIAMFGVMGVLVLAAALLPASKATPGEEVKALPADRDAIEVYISRLQVGPPQRHANLTLYPIYAQDVLVPDVDLTLDKAMEQLKPADVNRVRLRNRAKGPVFVMGGEMLGGAKQDRIVGEDMIVPPSSELVIPVYCVEHGRWIARTETFTAPKLMAGIAVRQAARASADQSAVWSSVAAEQDRLQAPSVTGALRSVHESEQVQEKRAPYTRAFTALPDDLPKARGVVACVGHRIIAADLFSSQSLFRQLWPKLLDSYVVDAIDRETGEPLMDAVDIKRWLDGVKSAGRSPKDTPGDGRLYELRGGGVMGSALVYDGGVVHVELFRHHEIRPLPFNRLQFRRDRLGQDDEPLRLPE